MAAQGTLTQDRRKVEQRMESLLGSNWRHASAEKKLDVLPHLWRELRDEYAPSAPVLSPAPGFQRADAPANDPFHEKQHMVQAIMEVVLDTTSEEENGYSVTAMIRDRRRAA